MPIKREVYQYTQEYEYIDEFTSITEASESTGVNAGNISKVCNNILKQAGGYLWSHTILDCDSPVGFNGGYTLIKGT